MRRPGIVIVALLLAICCAWRAFGAPLAVMAPNQPSIEEDGPQPDKKSRKRSAAARLPKDEVDVLIALLEPFANHALDMDRPSLFASLYYPPNFDPATMRPEFRNLLGDLEEIRYLDHKAWGANVDVANAGLYQFVLEGKPWWNEKENCYLHQQIKTILPVRKVGDGWNTPFGQSFEILPLTRPFGLTAPTLFSARVLLDGKPQENIPIRMGRVNTEHAPAITVWHQTLEARSDSDGEFSFVLPKSGWWYCEAQINGSPLKGPDGEMKERKRSTILWIYVDAPAGEKAGK